MRAVDPPGTADDVRCRHLASACCHGRKDVTGARPAPPPAPRIGPQGRRARWNGADVTGRRVARLHGGLPVQCAHPTALRACSMCGAVRHPCRRERIQSPRPVGVMSLPPCMRIGKGAGTGAARACAPYAGRSSPFDPHASAANPHVHQGQGLRLCTYDIHKWMVAQPVSCATGITCWPHGRRLQSWCPSCSPRGCRTPQRLQYGCLSQEPQS